VGFRKGFEKVAFVPLLATGARVLGAGLRGAARLTGGGSGGLGLAQLGVQGQQTFNKAKVDRNLALGAMRRQ
jgi:hypothetical protein